MSESYERAVADLEMLAAAYPEEVRVPSLDHPLRFTLTLPCGVVDARPPAGHGNGDRRRHDNFLECELPRAGYPDTTGLTVRSFRHGSDVSKTHLERTVRAAREAAADCLADAEEAGFRVCQAALATWEQVRQEESAISRAHEAVQASESERLQQWEASERGSDIVWVTGEILTDRKSTFQAHLAVVNSDDMVRRALAKLIGSSSKIQRASHNMYAYRYREERRNASHDGTTIVLKHDNDDDGEDGAGSKLAQLLEMRNDDGVLVVVSRWFGGVHLGPKRFAHIANVSRALLVACHADGHVDRQQAALRASDDTRSKGIRSKDEKL